MPGDGSPKGDRSRGEKPLTREASGTDVAELAVGTAMAPPMSPDAPVMNAIVRRQRPRHS